MTDYSRFEDDIIVNSYHAQSPSKIFFLRINYLYNNIIYFHRPQWRRTIKY